MRRAKQTAPAVLNDGYAPVDVPLKGDLLHIQVAPRRHDGVDVYLSNVKAGEKPVNYGGTVVLFIRTNKLTLDGEPITLEDLVVAIVDASFEIEVETVSSGSHYGACLEVAFASIVPAPATDKE